MRKSKKSSIVTLEQSFFSFHILFILIICLYRLANITLPVIHEVYYCNCYYLIKYGINFKEMNAGIEFMNCVSLEDVHKNH